MKNKYFVISNNKIVNEIDIAPFSPRKMDELVAKEGWDGWFELDEDGALMLMNLKR